MNDVVSSCRRVEFAAATCNPLSRIARVEAGGGEARPLARTFLRVLTLTENERTALDDVSFAEWLGPVPSRARTLFWDPIVEATLNGPLEMSSAAIALRCRPLSTNCVE